MNIYGYLRMLVHQRCSAYVSPVNLLLVSFTLKSNRMSISFPLDLMKRVNVQILDVSIESCNLHVTNLLRI